MLAAVLVLPLLAALPAAPAAAAVAPGDVMAWGDGSSGQLGDGGTTSRLTPTAAQITDVVEVDAGLHHTVALKADGSVWTWGNNPYGQQANGTIGGSDPVPHQVGDLPPGVIAVAAGGNFSLAVDGAGNVWRWGSMSQNNDHSDSFTAPTQVAGITGVTKIAAGSHHALAITADGKVWAWGQNPNGEFGDGTRSTSSLLTAVPTTLTGVAVAIAAGSGHSLAVDDQGQLWAWGRNDQGQIGDGTLTNRVDPTPIALQDCSARTHCTTVAASGGALAAGIAHSLVTTTSGAVYGWGRNGEGQIGGDPATTPQFSQPVATGLTGVTEMAAGGYFSLAVQSDGAVQAWGSNSSGQLGDGTQTSRSTPAPVPGLAANLVAAGGFFSVAITQPPAAPEPPAQGAGSIVFTGTADGGDRDIYVVNEDGSGRTQLTANTVDDSFPDWSPNASRIVFESARDGGDLDIFTMNPDGTGAVNLTSDHAGYDGVAAWSPTGSTIAFVSGRSGQLHVWLMNADGTNPRQLTTTSSGWSRPAWAPDGRRIVIHRSDGDLYAISIADGSETRLTNDSFGDQDSAWSPDGRHIAYQSNRGSGPRIYVIDLQTVDPATGFPVSFKLTDLDVNEGMPTFSPDGSKVAYSSATVGGPQGLFVAPLDKSSAPAQITTSGGEDARPAWANNLSLTVDGWTNTGTVEEVALVPPGTTAATAPVSVPASPSAVPLEHIPAQLSPAVQPGTAPLSALPSLAPLSALPSLAPLSALPSLAPLSALPSLAPLSALPSLAPLSALPSLAPLSALPSLAPAAQQVLGSISLLSLVFADGIDPLLAGSALAGRQPQDISLLEALQDTIVGPRLEALGPDKVSLASSLLSGVGLGAILLGPETDLADFAATGFDFCRSLNGLRQRDDCSADLGGLGALSALDLQILGLNIADGDFGIPFHTFPLSEIDVDPSAALLDARISDVDLFRTSLGSVLISAIPDAKRPNVVDCSNTAVDCTTGRLHDAKVAGALLATATFADLGTAVDALSLGEVVYGLLGLDVTPYEAFPPDQLGILPYEGAGASLLDYVLTYAAVGSDAVAPTFRVVLPPTFAVNAGSVELLNVHSSGKAAGVGTDVAVSTEPNGVVLTVKTAATFRPGETAVLSFTGYPGLSVGSGAATASVTTASSNQVLRNTAPVVVTENFEDNDTAATAIPVQADVLHLATPGDADFYSVSAAAGSVVEVFLGNAGSGDNDLVVYYPAGVQVADPLRQPKRAERSIVPILDQGPTLSQGGEPISAETREDLPLEDLPVAGLSDNRSRENEVVRFVALPGGDGRYLIQVSPYLDDAFAGAYSLRVRITEPVALPPCEARTFPYAAGSHVGSLSQAPASIAADRKTIFLVDWARLSRFYDDPNSSLPDDSTTPDVDESTLPETQVVANKLALLASHPKVNGVVIPINAYGTIQDQQVEADADPCSVEPTNDVVRAINGVVDGLLATSGASIENVVLIGSEEVVPRALVPDVTQVGNEALYTQQLQLIFPGKNNSIVGAGSHIRTDDPYGDLSPTPYLGRWLYTPDLAVGRLLETPGELLKAMQTFITYDGVVKASTAFTAGSDLFMQDVATAQDAAAETLLGSPQPDAIGMTWTKDTLEAGLRGPQTGDAPQVAAVNAHADQYQFEAPGSIGQPFTTADLDAIGDRIAGTVLFTMGCHSAQSPADVLLGVSDPARVRDWGQAVAGNGGVFAGQSGFGLGLEATMAFTEDVMHRLSQGSLERAGDGTSAAMTIGQALAAAKQSYLADKGLLGVYDEKAVVQTTLFGLPMFEIERDPSLTTSATTTSAASASSSILEVSPIETDTATGLQAVTVHSEPSFNRIDVPGLGSYDTVDGKTYEAHYRPIQPKIPVDVTQSGLRAHGAAPVALTTSQPAAIDPIFAMPALAADPSQPREPQFGNVIFPAAPTTLTGIGDRDTLVLVPGQFQAHGVDPSGKVVGEQIRITSSDTKVWYSTSDDFIQPVIRSFQSVKGGGAVVFEAEVTDETDTGAKGPLAHVYVLFRDDAGWRNLTLAPVDGTDLFRASASFTGTDVESAVIAVDQAGNVGSSWNKGDRFDAALAPESSVPVTAAVAAETPPPVNGWYLEAQVVIDGGGKGVEYRVNEGDFIAYDTPISLTTSGVHVIDYHAADLSSAGSITVPVDVDPPVITELTAPADPQALGTAVTATLAFTDPRTTTGNVPTAAIDWGDGTAPETVPVTAGDGAGWAVGSHVYASAGIYTVSATVTDPEGRATTAVFEYVVVYDPEGGFVTGGGHIESPAGAYTADPSLTGKATFGFVSRYKKGAVTPSGNTQFRFQAAGFNFSSDLYEWLVVSGARAQYKGHGAINGATGYSFMLTAIDGQISGGGDVDKLRMKIWNTVTGEVVYDNQLGDADDAGVSTAISGGSITIKK